MIRDLSDADVETIAAGAAQLPLMIRYKRTKELIASDLLKALAAGDGLFVWDEQGRPSALCWYFADGTFAMGGYLRLIAVDPATQSKGIGAKLLAEFERRVGARSRHAFLLCSSFNIDAQRFYERHGYARVGTLPGLVLPDVDEHIYWKRIPKP